MSAMLVRGLQSAFDRRRRRGGRDQILRRRIGRYRLAVIIELRSGSVARNDDPELVRPLHGDVVAHRVEDRRSELTGILIADGGGESHRLRRREPGGGGLEQVQRPRLKHHFRRCRRLAFRRRRSGWSRPSCALWLRLRTGAGCEQQGQAKGKHPPQRSGASGGRPPDEGSPICWGHGIIPHWNILLAIGPATLFRNATRMFGS